MKIQSSDYFLVRFCERSRTLLRFLGDWETRFLSSDLARIQIEKPVFITGFARSGTTLLLELLASVEGVATHRYRDFPLLMTPYFWNWYLDLFPSKQVPVERAHQDRIRITRESPEAMEEPLWHAFFPHIHSLSATHRLTAGEVNPEFERFFQAHLRKLLLIRRGHRYVSKGNYNVTRIEYLSHLFPEAQFIVPIRHPATHVHSLVRQHELFSRYALADARVPKYLAAAGHFEFGPQRIPTRLDANQCERILDAWARGEEYVGYAIQWAEIYRFVDALRKNDSHLADRILVVRYEDLCSEPEAMLRRILHWTGFDLDKARNVFERLDNISESTHAPVMDESLRSAIGADVHEVAKAYDYCSESSRLR